MPLGSSNTTKAYPLAWKYTFSYCLRVLRWPPLSHFKEKRVFFLTSPWFQHYCKITYNFPNTEKKALRQGGRQFLFALSLQFPTAPTALSAVAGAALAW